MLSYDLCLYEQLVYNKGSKIIQCGNDSLFNNWCKEKCRHMQKKIKQLFFHTMHKINSKWIQC